MSRKIIYPACAGINPGERQVHRKHQHLPRMRGDQPDCQINRHNALQFTPHARGSPYADPRRWFCSQIYPAGAGINPIRYASGSQSIDLPRMRGDQPASGTDRADMPAFTPQARGSTQIVKLHPFRVQIYPACAGISPILQMTLRLSLHLPRMRGDQPGYTFVLDHWCEFTPHARGSSLGSVT